MALRKKPFFPPFSNDVYLMLTEKCPMRCEYCYIKHRADGESMTRETMDKAMEKAVGRPRIIFFGGEPLLKIDEMAWFIDKYKDRCSGFQTVTSASVNFEEFYKRIFRPNMDCFELQMSWDGSEGTRKLFGDFDNSEDVYRKIKFLLDENARFQVRSVINDTNINRLYYLYLKFRNIAAKHDKFCADMTLAHQERFDESFPQKLGHGLKRILALIETDVEQGRKPYIEQWILNYIGAAANGTKIMGCNVGTEIIIRPNGDVYPCTMLSQCGERFKMGNVYDDALDTSVIDNLVRQPAECTSCNLKDACMGGCRYEKIARTGDLDIVNPCYCDQAKTIVPLVRKWLEGLHDDIKSVVLAHAAQYIRWRGCERSTFHAEAWRYREREMHA